MTDDLRPVATRGPMSGVPADEGSSLSALLRGLRQRWALLAGGIVLAGAAGYAGSFLVTPLYTATSAFLPPQQAHSSAAAALASLGPLAALAGGSPAALRAPADQYVALMQSVTVSDRIIDQFKLQAVYDKSLRMDARRVLAQNVRISASKRDGLITVNVDDPDPRRAAEIANRYVDELRQVTSKLAVTEAQQRRLFFEQLLQAARDQLARAQSALESSGFTQGALRAEPKAAAESYARLRAEATAAEVRLKAMRSSLADNTPEVRQLVDTLSALRAELARAERATDSAGGPDYISRYRDYKYQETLFELYARQFELARVDESRDGALIQVVDAATPPERPSQPRRVRMAMFAAAAAGVLLLAGIGLTASRTHR